MDKIICLGKNYLEHAKEMGDGIPKDPVLFLKPPSATVVCKKSGETIEARIPKGKGDVHPEIEVVLRLGKDLKPDAFTIGFDLTLRDLQAALKKEGHPWEISKAFDGSAVVGPWLEIKKFQEYESKEFSFSVNGVERQKAKPNEMRMKALDATEYCAKYFKLCPGDLIFTGTPAGVGLVVSGDRSTATFGEISYNIFWK